MACGSPGTPTPHEMNSPPGGSGTSWPSAARPSRQRTPVDHAQHRVGGGVVRELDHRVEYVAEAHGSVLDPPRGAGRPRRHACAHHPSVPVRYVSPIVRSGIGTSALSRPAAISCAASSSIRTFIVEASGTSRRAARPSRVRPSSDTMAAVMCERWAVTSRSAASSGPRNNREVRVSAADADRSRQCGREPEHLAPTESSHHASLLQHASACQPCDRRNSQVLMSRDPPLRQPAGRPGGSTV